MQITELRAENFRLFERLNLRFDQRLVLFTGDNAVGKTSLLEMLYVLGRGRSFRAQNLAELSGPASKTWTSFVRTREPEGQEHAFGARWEDASLRQRCDAQDVGAVDMLRAFPVQILEPGMHRVLEEGPTYRRSFIDWGVFHVEPSFMSMWRRYKRALRQRNQVLKLRGSDREVSIWEPELTECGELLHGFRQAHVASLQPQLDALVRDWLPERVLELELHPGWSAPGGLSEALAAGRERDRKLGTTVAGPHRAELRLRLNGLGTKGRISRGQQKLLLASLLLAQCAQIYQAAGIWPVLLIDDFSAELASAFQDWLWQALCRYPGPVFVSSFDGETFAASQAAQMFHVEHGQVRPLG